MNRKEALKKLQNKAASGKDDSEIFVRQRSWKKCPMKLVSISTFTALVTLFVTPGFTGPTTVHIGQAAVARGQEPRIQLNGSSQSTAGSSSFRVAGFPSGPTQLPYPLLSTPANDAWVRNNAWTAYNADLRRIPTAENPNRLAMPQNVPNQDRFIQRPQSSGRYNFQFSDHEIRSVQAALRRLGIYSGQVDGILGHDTQRAVEDYQFKNKLPITGQPDQKLNALLGIY